MSVWLLSQLHNCLQVDWLRSMIASRCEENVCMVPCDILVSHAESLCDGLHIHHDPDQVKVVTEFVISKALCCWQGKCRWKWQQMKMTNLQRKWTPTSLDCCLTPFLYSRSQDASAFLVNVYWPLALLLLVIPPYCWFGSASLDSIKPCGLCSS